MEVTALLGAIGSTWALAFMCDLPMCSWIRHALVCNGRWHRLRHLLLSLGWVDIRRRRWSGTIGQYNLLHLCSRDRSGGHPVGTLAENLGLEDQWNKFHYSGSLLIPHDLKETLFDRYREQMSNEKKVNALGLLRKKWGDLALDEHKLKDHLRHSVGGVDLQEDILYWHIATDIFLANRVTDWGESKVRYIKVLSNYMMFLLVKRPYLLPGLVLHRMYDIACENLVKIWIDHGESQDSAGAGNVLKKLFQLHDDPSSTSRFLQREQLAKKVYQLQQEKDYASFSTSDYRIEYGANLAAKLLRKEKEGWSSNMLDVILDVWMDFLFYVANRCSRESYAKKLNSGAELTAILWLMGAHFQPYIPSVTPPKDDDM